MESLQSWGVIADINECTARTKCQCPECKCTNKWGSYDCQCSGGLLYFQEHDTCISEYRLLGWRSIVKSGIFDVLCTFCGDCIESWAHSILFFVFADRKSQQSKVGLTVSLIVLAGLAALALGGYVVYKYRLRVRFRTFIVAPVYSPTFLNNNLSNNELF